MIRIRPCISRSCGQGALRGTNEIRCADALRVLCEDGSWGVGCVLGGLKGRQEFWNRYSWEARRSRC